MEARIIDKQTAAHYLWGNNCDSWVLLDTNNLSVKQEYMPAGTREQLHFHHHAQQFFFVLQGTASFYINEQQFLLTAQQAITVPPGIQHFIANETETALHFLVISQPTTNNDRVTVTS